MPDLTMCLWHSCWHHRALGWYSSASRGRSSPVSQVSAHKISKSWLPTDLVRTPPARIPSGVVTCRPGLPNLLLWTQESMPEQIVEMVLDEQPIRIGKLAERCSREWSRDHALASRRATVPARGPDAQMCLASIVDMLHAATALNTGPMRGCLDGPSIATRLGVRARASCLRSNSVRVFGLSTRLQPFASIRDPRESRKAEEQGSSVVAMSRGGGVGGPYRGKQGAVHFRGRGRGGFRPRGRGGASSASSSSGGAANAKPDSGVTLATDDQGTQRTWGISSYRLAISGPFSQIEESCSPTGQSEM